MSWNSGDYGDERKPALSEHIAELWIEPSAGDQKQRKVGFWAQFPWRGAGALVFLVAISIAAVVVLVLSNGKPVSQWDERLAPNVILSVLNSASGVCIAIVVVEGIVIVWWRKALHGTTVENLHATWSFGRSLSPMFLNFKLLNIAALAALVAKFSFIGGVLFQRSTTTFSLLGPKHTQFVTTYPTNALPLTGRFNRNQDDIDYLLPWFSPVVKAWEASANGYSSSMFSFFDCEGICALNMAAPGYVAKCSFVFEERDLIAEFDALSNSSGLVEDFVETEIFKINFNTTLPTADRNYTWIGMNTTSYKIVEGNSSSKCPARLRKQQCELRQALINYPIYVRVDNIITKTRLETVPVWNVYLGGINETDGMVQPSGLYSFNSELGQIDSFDFIEYVEDERGESSGAILTASGGIYRLMQDRYASRAYVNIDFATKTFYQSNEGFSNSMVEILPGYNNRSCPLQLNDPTTEIMLGLNSLAFLTSDYPFNRDDWINNSTQDPLVYLAESGKMVLATMYKPELHYQTNYRWMFGALASILTCICLIIPTYWRFWELGRAVSFNPIEIAAAFQAPSLAGFHPKTGYAEDVVRIAKSQRVKYVLLEDAESSGKFGFVTY